MKKVISIDAETNGLWGKAFSIAAVARDEHGNFTEFVGRCPIDSAVNSWVAENVLPFMSDIDINYGSYTDMLTAFAEFYISNKNDADVIVHMGLPVEARVFLDMHEIGAIGDWDAPYPLIDISALPEINVSVDTYNTSHGLTIPFKGNTHHPLYDAYAALVAYTHIA